jgi:plasmid stabilization system protein ParE
MRLVWNTPARGDLREILSLVADHDAALAEDLGAGIEHCVEGLADHPYAYPVGRVAGTREALVHPNYGLAYRIGEDTVEVVGVLHTSREFPAH